VNVARHYFYAWLDQSGLHLTLVQQHVLVGIYSGTRSAQHVASQLPHAVVYAAKMAFIAGMHRVMEVAMAVSLLSVITGFAMTKWRQTRS
jgi:hypothetical protein